MSLASAVYTRWGRTECESTAELVYEGIVGGGWYASEGSASNPLCLVREPKWNRYDDAVSNAAWIFGTEYRLPLDQFRLENPTKFQAANMPCSVCRTASRSTVIMVPGRNDCFKGWTLEYQGYLMAGHYSHKMASEYICVDEAPEATEAGFRDELGQTFFLVEASCGSLPCPEYVHGREITCAVCSK
ncbi:hypothetical protein KUTeg_012728 [Tegillarca granosa]|uniref:Short-chain collagen C4-like n=1 Tax=Tegillarca granosa TaxID=220873 RepID=A0ABQ9F0H1_TEGGR|nr:hypothetical protein KUTeg_012728 [Tegillarca granosa]